MKSSISAALAAISTFCLSSLAWAQSAPGDPGYQDLPTDGGIFLRQAASPIAEEVHIFHNWILFPVMVGISLFVLGLLIWIVLRYNSKANPTPSKFSHHTGLEIAWTLGPVFILLFIALFSFDLLYLEDKMPDGRVCEYPSDDEACFVTADGHYVLPNDFTESRRITKADHLQLELVDANGNRSDLGASDYEVQDYGDEQVTIALNGVVPPSQRLRITGGRSRIGEYSFMGFGEDNSRIIPRPSVTVKAIGFQWGWRYQYPDFGDFEFSALIAPEEEVGRELFRFAATNDVVVPVGETIRIITTADDVIHAWALPAFAVKIDAVPGRLNETWIYTEHEGTYYGQCSEICGIDHSNMPISVRVVSRSEFEAWVNEQRDFNGMDAVFAGQPDTEQRVALIGTATADQE